MVSSPHAFNQCSLKELNGTTAEYVYVVAAQRSFKTFHQKQKPWRKKFSYIKTKGLPSWRKYVKWNKTNQWYFKCVWQRMD